MILEIYYYSFLHLVPGNHVYCKYKYIYWFMIATSGLLNRVDNGFNGYYKKTTPKSIWERYYKHMLIPEKSILHII